MVKLALIRRDLVTSSQAATKTAWKIKQSNRQLIRVISLPSLVATQRQLAYKIATIKKLKGHVSRDLDN